MLQKGDFEKSPMPTMAIRILPQGAEVSCSPRITDVFSKA